MGFTEGDVPDLSGRVYMVTGANSGLGYETSRMLARRHAHVVMACRSQERGEHARDEIVRRDPQASLEVARLDLASLTSIERFVRAFAHERLDGLCNNAGVMAIPRRETDEGFEMQLGTNHLGPFALTAGLWSRLVATPGARVVVVTSLMHRLGRVRFDDLMGVRRYGKWAAYGQSKLANLLFFYELDRRVADAGVDVCVAAAHPGYAATNLQRVGPKMAGRPAVAKLASVATRILAQDAGAGALPQLRALAGPGVRSGDFFGPATLEVWGAPVPVSASSAARDPNTARDLWDVSERLTGARFPGLE
ncbi:MAG: oxidoreductase [Myxococcota bacterium]